MAPFLFLIVAKGLAGLIKNAVNLGIYELYSIKSNLEEVLVSHVQHADDTILVGNLSVNNASVWKGILRSFELASGLKIKFHKSCIMGIKDSVSIMDQIAAYMNYKVGSVPFKFLGILVGANPRKASTWSSVVQSMRSRLLGWRNKHLSMDG